MTGERVAVFRPADDRLDAAIETLESLDASPVADPLLAVEPTGAAPRTDADCLVLTSKTGAELLPADWEPGAATVCAIGPATAAALRSAGLEVDVVPETYSSTGLVEALADAVDGARVEIARSDHGSPALPEGLSAVGAYCHETVLYRLVRPSDSGTSADLAAAGDLDAALFTSSLTAEHFVEAAAERDVLDEALASLESAAVGAIGEPTRETAESLGIDVDVVPEEATYEALAEATVHAVRSA